MRLLFVNEPLISRILQDYWQRVGKSILKAWHGKNGPGGKALAVKLDDLSWFLGLRCCKDVCPCKLPSDLHMRVGAGTFSHECNFKN